MARKQKCCPCDDGPLEEIDTKDDLKFLGWTTGKWFIHKWRARFIAIITFAFISLVSYLIYYKYKGGKTEEAERWLIALSILDTLLIGFYFGFVHPHVTLPFKSLDKSQNRFTGRAAVKRQTESIHETEKEKYERLRNEQELAEEMNDREKIKQLTEQIRTLEESLKKTQEALQNEQNNHASSTRPLVIQLPSYPSNTVSSISV